ncbi:biliverdin-producing heme oxygenase [Umezawaea tangerina]|uniref:biliverdin-producing heme oxygenase n=1 Tax=Umezawaea tangerina TaxID=84725 RepID=UPI0014754C59|nr:biliverdin-producing heme oxygenase [Umezawaea tangerina]
MATSLLQHLRTGTRAAHRALEDDLGFLSRLTSPSRYEEVLAAFLGFHEPLEKALEASIAAHRLPWELPPGADHLAADLLRSGWSPARIAALPRSSPPDVRTLPALVGSLYVLEGSRLGGRLITRWVGDALGAVPVSFFAGDGDTRRRFRGFCAMAEDAVLAEDAQAVGEAANSHFLLFQEWLSAALPSEAS